MFESFSEDEPRWRRHIRPMFQSIEPLYLLLIGLIAFNPSVLPYMIAIANGCLQIVTGALHLVWAYSPWSFIAIGIGVTAYIGWQAYHNMPEKQYKPDNITPYVHARVEGHANTLELGYQYLINAEQRRQVVNAEQPLPSEEQSSLTGAASSHLPISHRHSVQG